MLTRVAAARWSLGRRRLLCIKQFSSTTTVLPPSYVDTKPTLLISSTKPVPPFPATFNDPHKQATFDQVMTRFLAQETCGAESQSLSNQLVFFDFSQVDSHKLVSVLSALAKLKQRDLALCEKIAAELQTRQDVSQHELHRVAASLEQLGCLQITLARLVTSLETMSLLGEPFDFAQCRRICQDLCKRENIPTSSLVSICASLAAINYFDRDLFEHIAGLMLKRDNTFVDLSLHNLKIVLNAFARLDFNHREWLDAFAWQLVLRDLSSLTGKDLCVMLNSFARLKYRNRLQAKHFIDEILKRDLHQFTDRELVSMLVSLGAIKLQSRRLCGRVAKEFCLRQTSTAMGDGDDTALVGGLRALDMSSLASLINAYATVRINDAKLFRLFCDEILSRDLSGIEEDDMVIIMLKSLQVLVAVDLYETIEE